MRCFNCNRDLGDRERPRTCPYCGWLTYALPKGSRIFASTGTYALVKILGAGGFGITYQGVDVSTGNKVAIKEFFPSGACKRGPNFELSITEGRADIGKSVDHFCLEAQILASLKSCPSVVDVVDLVRTNGTAYLVMELVEGQSLKNFIDSNGGVLPYQTAKWIFYNIALALEEIHRVKLIHSDISPANVMIQGNGQIKLIDLGAARNVFRSQIPELTVQMKPGYSPPEQYSKSVLPLGPWTDIFALGCTYYKMLTGRTPRPVEDRLSDKNGKEPFTQDPLPLSPAEAAALRKSLALKAGDRQQSIGQLLAEHGLADPLPGAEPPPPKWIPIVELRYAGRLCASARLWPWRKLPVGRGDFPGSCQGIQYVSNRHLWLKYDLFSGKVWVQDTSTNGTKMQNGAVLSRQGQELRGSFELSLVFDQITVKVRNGRKAGGLV